MTSWWWWGTEVEQSSKFCSSSVAISQIRLENPLRIVIQEYGDRNLLNRPQSASDAHADDERRSNQPTPTHRFCHSAIFRPIPPYNVWFFWVSRHRSIILAKKMETFSGRFWEIPGNVLKLELLKMLIDHKNTSVFFQAVSGMSSWSFSYRWTQYQWEKKQLLSIQFITLLAREEKNKDVFSAIFSFECPFSNPPPPMRYFIQIPHIMFCCPLSAYDKINDDLSKKNHHIFGQSI